MKWALRASVSERNRLKMRTCRKPVVCIKRDTSMKISICFEEPVSKHQYGSHRRVATAEFRRVGPESRRRFQLRPEHVSIYMLDAEERSAWGKQAARDSGDEDFARFYLEAAHRLQAAGYVHYEISNWALPGHECIHNLRYWNGSRYRGFGVSAHSYDPDDSHRRFWNTLITVGLREMRRRR